MSDIEPKNISPKLAHDGLLEYLIRDPIYAAFEAAPGNEIKTGKFLNPESSAALAANTFGFFMEQPATLPPIPGTERCGWPAVELAIERTAPFPWWPRGRHPWLDVYVETKTHIIGVESKRYEPYRGKSKGVFSEAYWRPVWGEQMSRYEYVRDQISQSKLTFHYLDAVQLIKHAFGLRTEASRRSKRPCLVYLNAEPKKWPNGRDVDVLKMERHRKEVITFADLVAGDEVTFVSVTYQGLISSFAASDIEGVVDHGQAIQSVFQP